MSETCQPAKDEQGRWAGSNLFKQPGLAWEAVYGEKTGWCNADPGGESPQTQ